VTFKKFAKNIKIQISKIWHIEHNAKFREKQKLT